MSGSLKPVKTTVTNGVPVWQQILSYVQGGLVLDNTGLTAGDTIKAGTPISYDELTRQAKVVKLATVEENAGNTATEIQVKKGHNLKVGEYIGKTVGGAAYAITEIDTSEADYDTITIGTTLGVALTAGDVLFISSATGASSAAYAQTAEGLLYDDVIVAPGCSISVVTRGTVYERRVAAVSAAVKATIPHIIFSQSY